MMPHRQLLQLLLVLLAGLVLYAPMASAPTFAVAAAERPEGEGEQPDAEQPDAEQPDAEQPDAEQPDAQERGDGKRDADRRRASRRPQRASIVRPFAPDSFWNAPLRRRTPLHPHSEEIVDDLVHQVERFGPWINTTNYSTPVYTVGRDQPTVRVHLDNHGSNAEKLQADLNAVPIPDHARPAGGTDGHMVVWQPSTDTMWELWCAQRLADGVLGGGSGWRAVWGARINRVSRSPGIIPDPFGATASGLPLIGGLMRAEELEARRIDHVLALAIPEVTKDKFVWPATRTDGRSDGKHAIPEGTRFRLDPKVDVAELDLPPVTEAMALAAQRYGIVVRDGAGAVVFYAEDPIGMGSNPYGRLFDGMWPNKLLDRFPWDRLQTVRPR